LPHGSVLSIKVKSLDRNRSMGFELADAGICKWYAKDQSGVIKPLSPRSCSRAAQPSWSPTNNCSMRSRLPRDPDAAPRHSLCL
jgi:hypothetical protein